MPEGETKFFTKEGKEQEELQQVLDVVANGLSAEEQADQRIKEIVRKVARRIIGPPGTMGARGVVVDVKKAAPFPNERKKNN